MTENELVLHVASKMQNATVNETFLWERLARAAIAAMKAAGWKGPDGPIVVKGAGEVGTSAIP